MFLIPFQNLDLDSGGFIYTNLFRFERNLELLLISFIFYTETDYVIIMPRIRQI